MIREWRFRPAGSHPRPPSSSAAPWRPGARGGLVDGEGATAPSGGNRYRSAAVGGGQTDDVVGAVDNEVRRPGVPGGGNQRCGELPVRREPDLVRHRLVGLLLLFLADALLEPVRGRGDDQQWHQERDEEQSHPVEEGVVRETAPLDR